MNTPMGAQERCPTCQASVAPDQEWCLECGSSLRGPGRRPASRWGGGGGRPAWSWLAGAAIVGAVIALAAGGLVLATRDSDFQLGSAPPPAEPEPGPETATTTEPQPEPAAEAQTGEQASGDPGLPTGVRTWPADLDAYTVVLATSPDRQTIERRATALARTGSDVGVLRSNFYDGFLPNQWVLWRGRYEERAKAEEAVALLRRAGKSGEVRFVTRG